MKPILYPVICAAACALVVAVSGHYTAVASDFDARGEVSALKKQVAELVSKVTSLEAHVKSLETKTVIVRNIPEPPSVVWDGAQIQVKPQQDILTVLKRGMFVPASE